ncbi:TPA: hypothetical protein HA278_00865 [Candidatus Woesearchaeota archaeon]|nr:hypothetical protein [archaeon]HIJ10582.1 hypothetical protein [Candidatus Woesearchaeota archaeon]
MAKLYQQKWWKRVFMKPVKRPKVDIEKDLSAIKDCLMHITDDVTFLQDQIKALDELEKERKVAHSKILSVNIETQQHVLEKLIGRYQSFQDDVDINGLRLKMIASEFLRNAAKAGKDDIVKEKKHDPQWNFQW